MGLPSLSRHPPAPARRTRLVCERLEDRAQPSVHSVRTAVDSEISASAPLTLGGTSAALHVETGVGGPTRQALIRFDSLFGPGPGQIPFGSTINAASLALWAGTPALPPSGLVE